MTIDSAATRYRSAETTEGCGVVMVDSGNKRTIPCALLHYTCAEVRISKGISVTREIRVKVVINNTVSFASPPMVQRKQKATSVSG